MTIKDILVHVDNSPASRRRLHAAVSLATAHRAHLLGLYVISLPSVPDYIRSQISKELITGQIEAFRSEAAKAEIAFAESTAASDISTEWQCVEGQMADVLAYHARYTDLTVVGQRVGDGVEAAVDFGLPDKLILSAGRPVLIIPDAGDFPVIGERIMAAWDASRLATRAIHDAIPFMRSAKHVRVMTFNPGWVRRRADKFSPSDICRHLDRHGVKAEPDQILDEDADPGEALIARARDEKIDLFVMGAYGRTRFREIVLGGVTRHVLQEMAMPVLMSH